MSPHSRGLDGAHAFTKKYTIRAAYRPLQTPTIVQNICGARMLTSAMFAAGRRFGAFSRRVQCGRASAGVSPTKQCSGHVFQQLVSHGLPASSQIRLHSHGHRKPKLADGPSLGDFITAGAGPDNAEKKAAQGPSEMNFPANMEEEELDLSTVRANCRCLHHRVIGCCNACAVLLYADIEMTW